MEIEFIEFPKIARLARECWVSEKIDGTNAQIYVTDDGRVLAGSRSRWITPEADNHGFARWVYERSDDLRAALGPGQHFGEWWGSGIQRRYGLDEKRFSLFNAERWGGVDLPPGVHVVPVLYRGVFTTDAVEAALDDLRTNGSRAAPGFMRPEGVVVWHTAARIGFKRTLEKDAEHKSAQREVA